MDSINSFLRNALRDGVLAGLSAALIALPLFGEAQAFYVLAGALFMALNLTLLGWLIAAATVPQGSGKGMIILLECAKLPLAYFLLYWLISREYAEPIGLVAGLTVALFATVFRGLVGGALSGEKA